MKVGKDDLDEVVVVDEKLHLAANDIKKRILDILNENDNNSKISIAALAETVDEFLTQTKDKTKKRSKKSINSKTNVKDKSNEVA